MPKRLGQGDLHTYIETAEYPGPGVVTLMTVHTLRQPLVMHLDVQIGTRVRNLCCRQMHV